MRKEDTPWELERDYRIHILYSGGRMDRVCIDRQIRQHSQRRSSARKKAITSLGGEGEERGK
jgi:hypothetical protein